MSRSSRRGVFDPRPRWRGRLSSTFCLWLKGATSIQVEGQRHTAAEMWKTSSRFKGVGGVVVGRPKDTGEDRSSGRDCVYDGSHTCTLSCAPQTCSTSPDFSSKKMKACSLSPTSPPSLPPTAGAASPPPPAAPHAAHCDLQHRARLRTTSNGYDASPQVPLFDPSTPRHPPSCAAQRPHHPRAPPQSPPLPPALVRIPRNPCPSCYHAGIHPRTRTAPDVSTSSCAAALVQAKGIPTGGTSSARANVAYVLQHPFAPSCTLARLFL